MKSIIKKVIKFIIPSKWLKSVIDKKISFHIFISLFKSYFYDLNLYFKFSDTKEGDTPVKLIGKIIKGYHVIEKGLTMSETRMGFGREIMINLCRDCGNYIDRYEINDQQLIHALGVIEEYKKFHKENNFQIDSTVISSIENLNSKTSIIVPSNQISISREEYFQFTDSNFEKFSTSRFSVRNFIDREIEMNDIINVLNVAKNAPSACNRQSWRTYVYSDKQQINEILKIQGGNRGFGHLANKLIIITGEVGVFAGSAERNQVFIDGGIYAMNMLYSLHFYKIAACILNCSNSTEKDKILRKLTMIKDSEVFISMVACGIPPDRFMMTTSKRYSFEHTNTFIT
jgi:nitroreductase